MEISKTSSATAYRRQRQIEDCLYENLLQRPYTSVSISDMCHQLDISRKSFYNYYPDKDSCFRAIINRKLQECMLRLTASASGDAGNHDIIVAFLTYCQEEKGFFDIVVRNNLVVLLMDQTVCYLRDEDKAVLERLNTPQLINDPYVLACYVNVNITFVLTWYLHNFDTSLEDMVQKYQRLIYEPLIHRN